MKHKILLSAYSCEPYKGSESEVGWSWALNLSREKNEVHVITRQNQKENIDKYLENKNISNLNFIYFDYPNWFIKIFKSKKNPNSYLYFILWQIGIFFKVYPLIKKLKFNYIHHVTFVSHRLPSFLAFYNIPFIFGPVSGGDMIPSNLNKNFTFTDKFKEILRKISNLYIKVSPLMNLVFLKSKKIYVNSIDTKNNIPSYFHKKTDLLLAIGINETDIIDKKNNDNEIFRLCFGGNLINYKGINILMKTFLKLRKKINCELNIFGEGDKKNYILDFIKQNEIFDDVKLIGRLPRDKFIETLSQNDLLFAPVLKDSGSFITLEAMSKGLPCAVLNIGGPDILVDNNCGIKINVQNKNENEIVDEFVFSIYQLILDRNMYKKKSNLSIEQSKKFTWKKKIDYIYFR